MVYVLLLKRPLHLRTGLVTPNERPGKVLDLRTSEEEGVGPARTEASEQEEELALL